MKSVRLFTDGSTRTNPGAGGWACILRYGKNERVVTGGDPGPVTNNQMELTALIEGLSVLREPCEVEFFSDSRYLVDGCNDWLLIWDMRGWKTARRRPIENESFWRKIWEFKKTHSIWGQWIKAHNGHTENERCDQLAKGAIP